MIGLSKLLALPLLSSLVAADFHLMSIESDYITCPSGEYNKSCFCYGKDRGEQVSNNGKVVHMKDVCGYGDIYLDWDQASNSMTIYDAGNSNIGSCYYNYGFVDNCIAGFAVLSVYDTYTCITQLCSDYNGKRHLGEMEEVGPGKRFAIPAEAGEVGSGKLAGSPAAVRATAS